MNGNSAWRFQLAPGLFSCRVLNGRWQVSGAHGRIDPMAAIRSRFDYGDAGFTTGDLADHYGPAEDFIGEFRRPWAAARGAAALDDIGAGAAAAAHFRDAVDGAGVSTAAARQGQALVDGHRAAGGLGGLAGGGRGIGLDGLAAG